MMIETEHAKWKRDRWHWLLDNLASLVINTRKSLMTSNGFQLVFLVWTLLLELCVLVPGCFMLIWTEQPAPTAIKYMRLINVNVLLTESYAIVPIHLTAIGVLSLCHLSVILYLLKLYPFNSNPTIFVNTLAMMPLLHVPFAQLVGYDLGCVQCSSILLFARPLILTLLFGYLVLQGVFLKFYIFPFENSKMSGTQDVLMLFSQFIKIIYFCRYGYAINSLFVCILCDALSLYFVDGTRLMRAVKVGKALLCISINLALILSFYKLSLAKNVQMFSFALIIFPAYYAIQPTNHSQIFPKCCLQCTQKQALELMAYIYEKIDLTQHVDIHVSRCRSRNCYLRECINDAATCKEVDEDNINPTISGYLLELLMSKSWKDESMRVIMCILLYKVNQLKMLERVRRVPIDGVCNKVVLIMIDKLIAKETERDQTESIIDEKVFEFEEGLAESVKHTISSMKTLVAEVKEKKLRVINLERDGAECYTAIQQIKRQFFRFSKYTSVNSRLTDFCLELFQNLLQETEYTEKIIRILKKRSHGSTEHEAKHKSSEPSLTCSDSGTILSVNSECCKFLRKLRHQLNNKPVIPFLEPTLPVKFNELMEKNLNRACYCLIRRGANDMIPMHIRVTKSKREYTMEFKHINKVKKNVYILLDPAGDICYVEPKTYNISSTINIDVRELYESETRGIVSLIEQNCTRSVNKRFGKVIISMSPFLYDSYKLLKLTILKTDSRASITQRNSSTVCIRPTKFTFSFDFYRKPMYIGVDGQTVESESNFYALTSLMRYTLIHKSFFDYGRNIKSYRLVNDRLFCIELEPSAQELLNNEAILGEDRKEETIDSSKSIMWYNVSLIFLILLFFSAVIASLQLQVSYTEGRATAATAINRIQIFEIHFQRAVCLLRDASETETSWVDEVVYLLKELPKLEKTRLFIQKNIETTFNGKKFKGCFDELCDILINKMFQVVVSKDLKAISSLIDMNEKLIIGEIQNQKAVLLAQYNYMMDIATIGLYVKIGTIGCIYVLFTLLVYLLNRSQERIRQQQLMHFRLMSDDYLNSMAERLDRFHVFFEMSEKNEDIDIFNQMTDERLYRERSKPKEVAYSVSDRWRGTAINVVTILFIIGMFVYTYISLTQIYMQEKDGVTAGYAISQVYASILRSSVSKTINSQQLSKISQNLQSMEILISKQLFEESLQNVIKQVFFGNACQVLPSNMDGECADVLHGRSNPFKYGLLFYFNHLLFNLIDDFQVVLDATGSRGKALYNIFEYVSETKQKEIERRSSDVVDRSKGLVIIEVFLGILMLFHTLVNHLSHQKRSTVNKQILTVLKWPQKKEEEETKVDSDSEVE